MTTQQVVERIKETMAGKFDMTCGIVSETRVALRNKKGVECAYVDLAGDSFTIIEKRDGKRNLFGSVAYQQLKSLLS